MKNITEIKNIFILTLRETLNRKWGSIGALDARKFPMDIVHAVHGIDGLAYPDHETLIQDAVSDGFAFFKKNEGFRKIPIGMTAGTWSACRVLRHVLELDRTALVMEDDWIFRVDYEDILDRLTYCEDDTQIATLLCKMHHNKNYAVKYANKYWIQGVPASAGGANIYTPAGIELVLKLFGEEKSVTVESVVKGVPFPTAMTIREPIAYHPLLMGYSRANPEASRQTYTDMFERWDKGYAL